MIIALGGHMGSGKNTVCDIIQDLCKKHNRLEFEQKAFAGKLKTIASLLTGIDVKDFEDQEFKKSLLGSEWGTVRTNPINTIPVFENVQFNELMSIRELLQKLGTDALRDNLHEDVWVNALFSDYKPPKMSEYNPSNWIITDMRFPNEMGAVVAKGGITIRVVRPGTKDYFQLKNRNGSITHATLHPSETSLDDAKFDYEIINDAGISELIEKVRQILITERII